MKSFIKIFLIESIFLFLTGCGGGGGGGGSSSGSTPSYTIPPVPEITVPNVSDPKSGYKILRYAKDGEGIYENILPRKENKIVGIYGKKITFLGNIEITDLADKNKQDLNIDGFSYGVFSKNGEIVNDGNIKIAGNEVIGIFGDNTKILNNKNIISSQNTETAIGIFLKNSMEKTANNNGKIDLYGSKKATGMLLHNATGSNNREITVSSPLEAVGMYVAGKKSSAVNNNKITIRGNGCGIAAGYGGRGINNGEINIENKGYGMYAFSGGYILNEGTINLSSEATGAMVADGQGSVAENRGTINIDKDNLFINNGEELKAINGGKIINRGNIYRDGDLFLSSKSGTYQIGTFENGEYGKVKAKNLKVDGNLEISSDIIKGSYKKNYLLKNIFSGEHVTLGQDININSASLLYDVKVEKNNFGNIDGKLIRNSKKLKDFVGKNLDSTAEIFNRYYDENIFSSLDSASKNILNSINLESSSELEKSLEQLTPKIYGNIQREILDLGNMFRENRYKSTENIKNEKDSFVLIESGWKIKTKENIYGYENLTSGFLGSKSLNRNNYLSFGYGYSEIDYTNDENSNIHSVHVGLDKIFKKNKALVKIGIDGTYNYHKTERKFNDKSVDSEFNSYGINLSGRISKTFNEIVDFTPFAELNLGYYSFENFEENIDNFILEIKSQDFVSCEPKAGLKIEKDMKNINIYSEFSYSSELGNTNKELDYTYKNINQRNVIEDKEEKNLFNLKIGVNYSKENMWINTNFGTNLGKRDNKYLEFNLGYKF